MAQTIKYLLLLLPITAFAHGHHVTADTMNETTIIMEEKKGVATAIATGNCQFDFSAGLQGCIAVGTFRGNDALVFGAAKRVGKLLINGTIGVERGSYSAGAAVNFRFP